jgi:hypothetical protein
MAYDTTGETLVATAGTPEPLRTDTPVNCGIMIKAMHTNTGLVYVCGAGLDGDSGLHLNKDESITYAFVGKLASIRIDSAVNGEGVRWALLAV